MPTRASLRACVRWNENHAKSCYTQLKREKNNHKRDRLLRDGQRYTRNAQYINHTYRLLGA